MEDALLPPKRQVAGSNPAGPTIFLMTYDLQYLPSDRPVHTDVHIEPRFVGGLRGRGPPIPTGRSAGGWPSRQRNGKGRLQKVLPAQLPAAVVEQWPRVMRGLAYELPILIFPNRLAWAWGTFLSSGADTASALPVPGKSRGGGVNLSRDSPSRTKAQ